MNKRYVFAIDLDGTALNDEGRLSDFTKNVFSKVIADGHQIIVASGRALESLPEEVRFFPGIRYVITSNGVAIHDLTEKKVLHKSTLSIESVRKILSCTEKYPVLYETFIDGHGYAEACYVENPAAYHVRSEHGVRYIQSTRKPVENMKEFIEEHIEELDCIDLILTDLSQKNRIWEDVKDETPDILITASVERMIEIADKKAGKGRAVEFLLEYLNVSKENTVAFGNAENDIDMMKTASIGCAVANSDPECLNAADFVTESNNDDGVARWILELLSDRKE